MFRKRAGLIGPENQSHKEERDQLTHHFHRSLKCLQQKEHVDGATIVSNEPSNNMCNVLEAVFLHGVKDNVMAKLVSYAQGIQGVQSEVKINFWHVVKKFTHKDVITQLKQLSQISTDIGLCRAWVRLAINDGLMASYLASMIADTKALMTFYHHWAYMLDYEQPEILRNHLTGLMNLHFNLSCNSSVLNKWSSTTLSLAGMLEENSAPSPVVRSVTPTPPTSRRGSASSFTSMDSLQGLVSHDSKTTTATVAAATSNLSVPSHTSHLHPDSTAHSYHISTPPNTPADPVIFSHPADGIEALKKLSADFQSPSGSSASSSLASCPDPDPCETCHLEVPPSMRSSQSNSPFEKPLSRNSPYGSNVFMTVEHDKLDEEMKLKAILDHLDQREKEDHEAKLRDQQHKVKDLHMAVGREQREKKELEKQQLEEKQVRVKEDEEEQHKPGQKNKEEKSVHKNNKKQKPSNYFNVQRVEVSGRGEKSVRENNSGDYSKSAESQINKTVSHTTISDSIEDAMITFDGGSQQKTVQEDLKSEDNTWLERGTCFGNSLNAMDGWSTASPCQRDAAGLEQSYETMLKGYHSQQGTSSHMASVQEVIEKLPEPQQTTTRSPEKNFYEPSLAVDESTDDIDFAEYEIIPSASEDYDAHKMKQMKMLCSYVGKNAQNNICANPKCNAGVGFFHGPGQVCEMDGQTYCDQCHLSQYTYIPAEIVFNWDFKKRKVCVENFQFLQRIQDEPLLDIDELCPQIYTAMPVMNSIMLLRTRLTSLRSYLFTCSESTAQQLKNRVWPREHLYDKVHSYSVNDLLDVRSGKMETFLKEVVDMCVKHVYSCCLCLAKGFYCELCQDSSPIFPFEIDSIVKCESCRNVYHSRCKTDNIPCPKCVRYSRRGSRRHKDPDSDYACTPE